MLDREAASTRRQIINLLRAQGRHDHQALAAELGDTKMGVHRHLVALEREGHAQAQTMRQSVGRPPLYIRSPINRKNCSQRTITRLPRNPGCGAGDARRRRRRRNSSLPGCNTC